eukprot:TRINITY_DN1357_c0_g1_i1.p1 TRINITY_DN1357_c0_g1~~TRINITY_DN1357_c0_g1_i1.p1  ORF type:complete len:672 (+),score=223.81 TRINITY_DN1357_c0_g1_i1:64-2079(+)
MASCACFHCRKSHRKCNNERPCNNCIKGKLDCFDEETNNKRRNKKNINAGGNNTLKQRNDILDPNSFHPNLNQLLNPMAYNNEYMNPSFDPKQPPMYVINPLYSQYIEKKKDSGKDMKNDERVIDDRYDQINQHNDINLNTPSDLTNQHTRNIINIGEKDKIHNNIPSNHHTPSLISYFDNVTSDLDNSFPINHNLLYNYGNLNTEMIKDKLSNIKEKEDVEIITDSQISSNSTKSNPQRSPVNIYDVIINDNNKDNIIPFNIPSYIPPSTSHNIKEKIIGDNVDNCIISISDDFINNDHITSNKENPNDERIKEKNICSNIPSHIPPNKIEPEIHPKNFDGHLDKEIHNEENDIKSNIENFQIPKKPQIKTINKENFQDISKSLFSKNELRFYKPEKDDDIKKKIDQIIKQNKLLSKSKHLSQNKPNQHKDLQHKETYIKLESEEDKYNYLGAEEEQDKDKDHLDMFFSSHDDYSTKSEVSLLKEEISSLKKELEALKKKVEMEHSNAQRALNSFLNPPLPKTLLPYFSLKPSVMYCVSNFPEGLTDQDYNVNNMYFVDVSPELSKHLGYEVDELINKRCDILSPLCSQFQLEAFSKKLLESCVEKVNYFKLVTFARNNLGLILEADCDCAIFCNENKKPIYIFAFVKSLRSAEYHLPEDVLSSKFQEIN